jgi:hypothetical protein
MGINKDKKNRNNFMKLKWDPYFFAVGQEFNSLWPNCLNEGEKLLFIIGQGFDPRMLSTLEHVILTCPKINCDAIVINIIGTNQTSPQLSQANVAKLHTLLDGRGIITSLELEIWDKKVNNLRRIGPRRASELFNNMNQFEGYRNVIIDISSLPRGIFFPMIGKIMDLFHQNIVAGQGTPNLFITLAEDPNLDKQIQKIHIDETASFLPLYGGDFELEGDLEGKNIPKLWIPILGERQLDELERLYTLLNPDEICPVLPYPSKDSRRADNLIMEYRELLFDKWRVEPENIMYASEHNPFELYRQLI